MKKMLLTVATTFAVIGCANNSTNSRVSNIGSMGDVEIVKGTVKSQRLNNLLVSQAVLKNTGNSTVNGYYRCKFLDANGMYVGSEQIWQLVTIYQNAEQVVKCGATDPEATDFRLEFSVDQTNVTALTY